MFRDHPLYIIVCILIAITLQFLLTRRFRDTLRAPVTTQTEEPDDETP